MERIYSVNIATIETFRKASLAAVGLSNSLRPRVTATVGGQQIDLLYDTGASQSCLSVDTYNRLLRQTHPLLDNNGASAEGAGNFDLGVSGKVQLDVAYKDHYASQHEFLVCQSINDDIMGIELAHAMELSYNAGEHKIYSVTPIEDSLRMRHATTIPALSTMIVEAKFLGQWRPDNRYLATIYSPRAQFLMGGPAVIDVQEDRSCRVAVVNTAPFDITMARNLSLIHI